MTPADRELAEAWFRKAEEDLLSATALLALPSPPCAIICFHCQQTAEKYLKGFLALHGRPFEETDDLVALVGLAALLDATIASLDAPAQVLADYVVIMRYPQPEPDPTPQEAQTARWNALLVRRTVRGCLGLPSYEPLPL